MAQERIDFKDAGKFFNWVTDIAKIGGIQISTIGTHDGKYWVIFSPPLAKIK